MKKYIAIIVATLSISPLAYAQSAQNASWQHTADRVLVDFDLDMTNVKLRSNQALLLTPAFVNDKDTITLNPIGIYGRSSWYTMQREGNDRLGGGNEQSYRDKDLPANIHYTTQVPLSDSLEGAQLILISQLYGCRNCKTALPTTQLLIPEISFATWMPELVYMPTVGEAQKSRSVSGSAFVEFPVNQTVINPDYHQNPQELSKITATIDSVRADADITVTGISLQGYASPEGPYAGNSQLAQTRTQSLRDYVLSLYDFPAAIFSLSSQPEDWAGLCKYLEQSNLTNRDQILAIAQDNSIEPDRREWLIKSRYPQDYKFLLENCYPKLRHTDYRIEYVIRSYASVDEISKVMQSRPQNLSLNEFYLLGQSLEPGSPEFTEVFETAVRMYPADEAANLNAANAAIRREDLAAAANYLSKAGESPQAVYARGVVAYLNGDFTTAAFMLNKVKDTIPQANEVLKHIK